MESRFSKFYSFQTQGPFNQEPSRVNLLERIAPIVQSGPKIFRHRNRPHFDRMQWKTDPRGSRHTPVREKESGAHVTKSSQPGARLTWLRAQPLMVKVESFCLATATVVAVVVAVAAVTCSLAAAEATGDRGWLTTRFSSSKICTTTSSIESFAKDKTADFKRITLKSKS